MAATTINAAYRDESVPDPANVLADVECSPDTKQLIDAFQVFSQASNSLEAAFRQLQARTRHLSEELAAKNRQLKKSLREREIVRNHLRRILESLPCGVVVQDADDGRITLCNPVAQQILGFTAAGGGKRRGAACGPGPQGRVMAEYFAALQAADCPGAEVEIPLVTSGALRTLAASVTPLTDAGGRRLGTLHILRDITEMKSLQEQNQRGERLAAMGEMAVELAHEIRNPLGSIELFASLLEKELSPGSDLGRWAENIRIGSRSLNNIVSNMLHFANPLSPAFQEVHLHDLADEVLRFTEPILRQREVRVERALEGSRPLVSGDRELLKQMLLNLVLNSLQAMPAQGSLRLATCDVTTLPGGASCPGLELRVEDTGLGIPAENLDRIFDPFFTTNKNGTGLGLSVVHQIIEQHSGFIRVESRVNAGTVFIIVLPSAPAAQACREIAS